jgi:hypothetical protein
VENRALNNTPINILWFYVLLLALGSMFVTFWNVLLVAKEAGGACVPNFDCYVPLARRETHSQNTKSRTAPAFHSVRAHTAQRTNPHSWHETALEIGGSIKLSNVRYLC